MVHRVMQQGSIINFNHDFQLMKWAPMMYTYKDEQEICVTKYDRGGGSEGSCIL